MRPVSIMTTVESRKPVLLIRAVEGVERERVCRDHAQTRPGPPPSAQGSSAHEFCGSNAHENKIDIAERCGYKARIDED